ncbi:MAG: hypothetical protein KAS23_15265 [Anaerohalosphaera sp.]|nr:hypothetical protein [Anaerohalosphaera sp.]
MTTEKQFRHEDNKENEGNEDLFSFGGGGMSFLLALRLLNKYIAILMRGHFGIGDIF